MKKLRRDSPFAGFAVLSAVLAGLFLVSLACFAGFRAYISAVGSAFYYPADALRAALEVRKSLVPGEGEANVGDPEYLEWAAAAAQSAFRYALATDNSGAGKIPEENRGPIVEMTYGKGTSAGYFNYGAGNFRNKTDISAAEAEAEAAKPCELGISLSTEPQVLIYHTHATESYDRYDVGYFDKTYPWRQQSSSLNVVSVGGIIAEVLNANGIVTLHSETLHDYPSYSGSYSRSRATIEEYLEKYPSIKLVIDIHRDAIGDDSGRYKPIAEIGGVKAAQFMIITGADDGTMDMPNYFDNLRLAARIQNTAEQMYPGLTRPALFAYCCYNQNVPVAALLIEVGTYANSLCEAQYTAELLGNVLANALIAIS